MSVGAVMSVSEMSGDTDEVWSFSAVCISVCDTLLSVSEMSGDTDEACSFSAFCISVCDAVLSVCLFVCLCGSVVKLPPSPPFPINTPTPTHSPRLVANRSQ